MIIFSNEGSLDIRALKTFGLSSKEGQDKIGRFGTGLKYATAVIARHGGILNIFTDGESYVVGAEEQEFRGRSVRQLTLNGEPLPFTEDLGRDWEPWMAFRELYANTLDEGGEVTRAESLPTVGQEKTVIAVDLPAFEAIFFSMEEHFIGPDEQPLWSSPSLQVYAGRSTFVFYQGVAIMKLEQPAAFRYNLLGSIDLTEDRTAKYDWQIRNRIVSGLSQTDNAKIATAACDFRNPFEAKLDFSRAEASKTFIGASVEQGANCNPTAMALVRSQLPDDGSTATIITQGQPGGKQLSEALSILRSMGADLSKCAFVLAEGINVFGDYDVRNKAVFLSKAIFENQDRMNLAVVEGYAEVVGNHWLARTAIAKVQAT